MPPGLDNSHIRRPAKFELTRRPVNPASPPPPPPPRRNDGNAPDRLPPPPPPARVDRRNEVLPPPLPLLPPRQRNDTPRSPPPPPPRRHVDPRLSRQLERDRPAAVAVEADTTSVLGKAVTSEAEPDACDDLRAVAAAATPPAPSAAKRERVVNVRQAAYHIDTPDFNMHIYKVEVCRTVTTTQHPNGERRKFTTATGRGWASRDVRTRALDDIVRQVLTKERLFQMGDYVFDVHEWLVSKTRPISAAKKFTVNPTHLSANTLHELGGARVLAVDVTFTHHGHASKPLLNESDVARALLCCDVLTRHAAAVSPSMMQLGNGGVFVKRHDSVAVPSTSTLSPSGASSFPDEHYRRREEQFSERCDWIVPSETNKELKSGFVLACGRTDSLVLHVDVQRRVFARPMLLMHYVMVQARAYNVDELTKCLGDPRKRHHLSHAIRGLAVSRKHLPRAQVVCCGELAGVSAKTCTLDEQTTTVDEYFRRHHRYTLKYPQLPLVRESGRSDRFHPLEMLWILDGNALTQDQLTEPELGWFSRKAVLKPCEMAGETERAIRRAGVLSAEDCRDDGYMPSAAMRKFNLWIDPRALTAEARVLHPPAVYYAKSVWQPNSAGEREWRGGEFVRGAKLERFVLLLVDRCDTPENAKELAVSLSAAGARRGMAIDVHGMQLHYMQSDDRQALTALFDECLETRTQLVIAVTKTKKDPFHDNLKDAERCGVVTQHFWQRTAEKIRRGGNAQLLDNVLMKMNLKLGGLNYNIQPTAHLLASGLQQGDWFGQSVMYVGLDVQPVYDESGAHRASVNSFVFTRGTATDMCGGYSLQSTKAVFDGLDSQLTAALSSFTSATSIQPCHIIIYRAGCNEQTHDLHQLAAEEMRMVAAGVKSAWSARWPDRPSTVTLIYALNTKHKIVDARAPSDLEALSVREQNVPAGTCITSQLTSRTYAAREFHLVPHDGRLGTSRGTTYRVMACALGQAPIPVNQLAMVTNALASAAGGVQKATSLPGPLFNAAKLAKRARRLVDMHTLDGLLERGQRDSCYRDAGAEMFARANQHIYTQLAGKCQFWA